MKRVLIPTDFSNNAWNTILYALELYKGDPCEFYILNSYEMRPVSLVTTVSSQKVGHLYKRMKTISEGGLERTLGDIENLKKDATEHSFHVICKEGPFIEVIKEIMDYTFFDMIIIGTKGATGAKAFFLGSNTQKLLKQIDKCPILVIPENRRYQKISSIAFPTNFEKVYYKAEINPILKFAKIHDATVRMIHVYDKPELTPLQNYNSNELEQHFKKVKYDFHVICNFSTLEKAIQAFIEELEIGMLVMINYKHSFIDRLLREPIIKKITFHTEIPFLVIPSDN